MKKDSIKKYLKNLGGLLTNYKFIISFGLAGMMTNGIFYAALGFSIGFNIGWLKAVAGSYIAFLYLPGTPEKLITIPISIFFAKIFFPRDLNLQDKLRGLIPKIKKNKKATTK